MWHNSIVVLTMLTWCLNVQNWLSRNTIWIKETHSGVTWASWRLKSEITRLFNSKSRLATTTTKQFPSYAPMTRLTIYCIGFNFLLRTTPTLELNKYTKSPDLHMCLNISRFQVFIPPDGSASFSLYWGILGFGFRRDNIWYVCTFAIL